MIAEQSQSRSAGKRPCRNAVESALEALGPEIRALRESRGMSQAALGEVVGRGQSYISSLERGGATPSLRTVLLIACALGQCMDSIADCAGIGTPGAKPGKERGKGRASR